MGCRYCRGKSHFVFTIVKVHSSNRVQDTKEGKEGLLKEQQEESLFDLISEYSELIEGKGKVEGTSELVNKGGKGKAGNK